MAVVYFPTIFPLLLGLKQPAAWLRGRCLSFQSIKRRCSSTFCWLHCGGLGDYVLGFRVQSLKISRAPGFRVQGVISGDVGLKLVARCSSLFSQVNYQGSGMGQTLQEFLDPVAFSLRRSPSQMATLLQPCCWYYISCMTLVCGN